jgi:hypothetical protein
MHIIVIPPSHFSIFMVQRGIIIMFMLEAGIELLIPGIIVDIPIPGFSIVIINIGGLKELICPFRI